MTTRRAYDSVTVSALPTGGDLYLGYVDGRYINVDAIHERFPRKRVLRITVTGQTFDAEMADVEAGDLKPAGAAVWAKGKLARGEFPILYFPESTRPAVVAALRSAGVDPAKVGMFPASYDGVPQLIHPHDIGKQYRAPSGTGAGKVTDGNYDVSVVAAYIPGFDPLPSRPLSPVTRVAVRLVTRRLRTRKRQVNLRGRDLLLALRTAVNHALGLK